MIYPVIINNRGECKRRSLGIFDKIKQKIKQEIMEEEDRRILEILDTIQGLENANSSKN